MENIVLADNTYAPGDYFRHYLQKAALTPGVAPDTNKLFTPAYIRNTWHGLVYWAPMSIDDGVFPNVDRVYNTLRLNHEPQNGFLQQTMDNPVTGQDFADRIGLGTNVESTINRVCGVKSAYGSSANDDTFQTQSRRPLFMADKDIVIPITTTSPNASMNDFPFFFRRDPLDPAGAAQNLRGRLRLSEYPIVNKCSTMVSIFFQTVQDATYNLDLTNNIYTVLGGVSDIGQTPVVQVVPLQTELYDVVVTDQTGSTYQLALTDGGGTRINILHDRYHHLSVQTTGGDNNLLIQIGQYDAALTTLTNYTANTVCPNPLCNIQYIGGCDASLTTADAFYTGILGEFRMYHRSMAAVTNVFQNIYTSLNSWAYGDFFSAYSFLCMRPAEHPLFVDDDAKYAHIGACDSGTGDQDDTNYGQVWALYPFPANLSTKDPNYPEIVDNYCIPPYGMPLDKRAAGPTTVSQVSSYNGRGSGPVQLNDINQIMEYGDAGGFDFYFEPYTWFDTGEDTPYFDALSEVIPSLIKDHGLRICIDNLPLRTYNGLTGNISKCIYQIIGRGTDEDPDEDEQQVEITVPRAIWHYFNNPGDIVLNSFDVVIRDLNEVEETNIKPDSNIVIQILGPNEM